MATAKQIFMKGLAAKLAFDGDNKTTSPMMGQSTPQAMLPLAKDQPKTPTTARPVMKNNYTGELRQVSDARAALAKVKASQHTYGVPGAK